MASYTLEHRNIAFSIYRKHGEINATLKELKKDPRFSGLNKSTLIAWANTPDANGKIWKDRLTEITKVSNDLMDLDLAKERTKTIQELVEMKDYIYKETLSTAVKTAEGGAKAYAILNESLMMLTGLDIKQEHLKQMSEAIFSALASHPVVGPMIKEYWEEIMPQIELNFKRMDRKK